jgi:antirestriction protein ArdC
VALHGLTHWTGAKHRLARDFAPRFGTDAYAFEELIAGLGSAFLSAERGFAGTMIPSHAGYIESWLKVLKNDKSAIFTAASYAERAAAFLHGLQPSAATQADHEQEAASAASSLMRWRLRLDGDPMTRSVY